MCDGIYQHTVDEIRTTHLFCEGRALLQQIPLRNKGASLSYPLLLWSQRAIKLWPPCVFTPSESQPASVPLGSYPRKLFSWILLCSPPRSLWLLQSSHCLWSHGLSGLSCRKQCGSKAWSFRSYVLVSGHLDGLRGLFGTVLGVFLSCPFLPDQWVAHFSHITSGIFGWHEGH